MKILVTGCAGFIGFHLCNKLIDTKNTVIGVDNFNSYYSVKLKKSRINQLKKKSNNKKFKFIKCDIADYKNLSKIFKKYKIKVVINLAAQAGVRYSLINPRSYIKNNLNGFFNILELSKLNKINHLIYASTSSIYGDSKKFPLKENLNTDKPLQLYAATKKSNEILAHSYSHLFKIRTTGLRFFTVYGPWGRPDMALFKFTKNIILKKPIEIFNYGNHMRDFTYVDDIVSGIVKIIKSKKKVIYEIVNLSNNRPVELMKYVKNIEKCLNLNAKKIYLPLQKGDVKQTHGSIIKAKKNYNYFPKTNVNQGIKNFVKWYQDYYIKKIY